MVLPEDDSLARARMRRLEEYKHGLRVPALGGLAMSCGLVLLCLMAATGRYGIPIHRNPMFAIAAVALVQSAWSLWRLDRITLEELEGEWEAAEKLKKTLETKRPWASLTVLALLVGVAIAQMIAGLGRSIDAAGLVKNAVRAGEVWRLLTAEMLHAGWLHLWFNLAALVGLGRALESVASRSAFATTFVISAVGASLFSLVLLPNTPSVGASGGIMGLVGFLLVAAWSRRDLLPGLLKNVLASTAMVALTGIAGWAYIDNAAHLGGLLTGIGVGLVLIDRRKDAPALLRAGARAWPGAVSLGVVAGACALAIVLMFR